MRYILLALVLLPGFSCQNKDNPPQTSAVLEKCQHLEAFYLAQQKLLTCLQEKDYKILSINVETLSSSLPPIAIANNKIAEDCNNGLIQAVKNIPTEITLSFLETEKDNLCTLEMVAAFHSATKNEGNKFEIAKNITSSYLECRKTTIDKFYQEKKATFKCSP